MDDLKPVFIVGTGRCGSQIFYRMLAHHEEFNWFTTLEELHPDSKFFRLIGSIVSKPAIYRILGDKIQPSEAYSIWKKGDPGLLNPYRSLNEHDVTEEKKRRLRSIVRSKGKGKRFLCKITGWSMIPYFNKVFPESKFIHVLRDGRAVVNSLLHVGFWRGWEGIHNWRWGCKEEYRREIEKYDDSFAAIAALQWKIVTKEIKSAGEKIGKHRFMEIKYEELVDRKIGVIRNAVDFIGSSWNKRFGKAISSYDLENRNYKWKESLSKREKKIIDHSLKDTLKEYGYI